MGGAVLTRRSMAWKDIFHYINYNNGRVVMPDAKSQNCHQRCEYSFKAAAPKGRFPHKNQEVVAHTVLQLRM